LKLKGVKKAPTNMDIIFDGKGLYDRECSRVPYTKLLVFAGLKKCGAVGYPLDAGDLEMYTLNMYID
jgi:hypothetical protein